MLATQVVLCVTVIGNIALFLVVVRERMSPARFVFAIYVASIAAWAFAIYLNLFLKSTFVEDWIFAAAAVTLTTQLWFAKLFPDGPWPQQPWRYWSAMLGGVFLIASFYRGALFHSITVHPEGYTTLDNGFLSALYSLFALVYVCAPIAILSRTYRHAHVHKIRRQLRNLIIGFTAFAALAVLTNSVLPVFFHFYALNAVGPSFSLVFAAFVFYTIAKHEFLDIKAAVQRGVIYSFLIAMVVIVYEVALLTIEHYFAHVRPLFPMEDDVLEPLSAAFVTAVGIYTIPFIERYFQRWTDRIFFKDRYEYAEALESLSGILHRSTDFDQLILQTQQELSRILRAGSAQVMLFETKDDTPVAKPSSEDVEERDVLFEPINADSMEIGYIVIGNKRSGDAYSAQDAQLLHTFALQASTAFARAKLFRQVQAHAIELEEKVSQRTDELRRSHERERSMVQDIAHGLQTPLAVFRTRIETSKLFGDDAAAPALFRSLDELSGFIQNLLKLAHLEHAPNALRFEPCDLSKLVQEIAEEVEIIARPRGIIVQYTTEPAILIQADEKELRIAIMNLAGNSLKYMRSSSIHEIEFKLMRVDSEARLVVRDTGIGISPEQLPHVFDRFYRGPGTAETGGGLGLAIVKTIVERHGGGIKIDSKVGEGTSTTVWLPCLDASINDA